MDMLATEMFLDIKKQKTNIGSLKGIDPKQTTHQLNGYTTSLYCTLRAL